jgi:hypothetical protein
LPRDGHVKRQHVRGIIARRSDSGSGAGSPPAPTNTGGGPANQPGRPPVNEK